MNFCGRWMATALLLAIACPAMALDHVSLERDGKPIHLSGKVVVEAEDGGVLLLDPEGVLWAVQGDELVRHSRDDTPFQPLPRQQLARKLLDELPEGFRVHNTAHYLICYNTSPAYAQWCGALYERLYLGFRGYWKHRGLELHEPELPLVALVFDNQDSYVQYAEQELGEATRSIVGYFSLRTNRVTMYDLTGADGLQQLRGRASSAAQINRVLSQPGAERMVATIIHEATHQLAFNCGLHARYADIPVWVSEGIAVYFETPDLRSSRGWRSIGSLNRVRLQEFRQYLKNRPPDSLYRLLADDQRFRHPRMATDAYAETWALTYYLLRTRTDDYVRYLQALAEKEPLIYDEPDERIALFRATFGEELDELDAKFLRYMSRIQ